MINAWATCFSCPDFARCETEVFTPPMQFARSRTGHLHVRGEVLLQVNDERADRRACAFAAALKLGVRKFCVVSVPATVGGVACFG